MIKQDTPPAQPRHISKIEIDFVKRTMTLWDFDEQIATYEAERTGFDLHIRAHDPFGTRSA